MLLELSFDLGIQRRACQRTYAKTNVVVSSKDSANRIMLKHFLKNNSYKIKRNSYYFVIISCWAIMIYFMHGCSLFGFKARMFAMGCSMGPLLHYWYIWLDRVYAGKALKTLVKKVVVDQLVASPTLGVWYFLGEKDFTGTKSCFSHVVQGVST